MTYWDKVISVGAMALVETSKPKALKEKLTIQNIKQQYTLPLYKETDKKNRLYIPRGLVRLPSVDAGWKTIDVKHTIKLKEPQKAIVDAFIDYINNTNPSGGIISAGTGVGKTIMGLWLACYYGLKTLIIVPTERIFHQWIEKIKKFTDAKDIGLIRGSLCDYDAPFTVAMLHTICKDRYHFLEKEFGVVVYDEVHTISTQYFNTVAGKFHSKINIGASATAYRKDGMQNVFFYHIGGIAVNDKRVDAIPKIIVSRYYDPASYHGDCMWNSKLNLGRYYNKLMNIERRNALIAKYANISYKNHHNILILTERLNHINKLISHLIRLGVQKEDIGKLTADIKEIDRKIIVGTYGSAGLGLDIPDLSCLILAMPRTDVVQAVGRVTRAKSREPIVIDIVDEGSPIMEAWFQKRLRFYRKLTKDIIYV